MDLFETYRQIARQYFLNTIIVADRFRVVRMVNQHFLKLWHRRAPYEEGDALAQGLWIQKFGELAPEGLGSMRLERCHQPSLRIPIPRLWGRAQSPSWTVSIPTWGKCGVNIT